VTTSLPTVVARACRVLAVGVVSGFLAGAAVVRLAAPASESPTHAPCPATTDVSACDADGDTIPDTVERVVAGSATGATGREDTDEDGVADWVEVMACGSVSCASPAKDSARDGIPDYARILTCGSATCWTDNKDVNVNGVPKWASVVICGTAGCATGHEDYDGDGVSDAIQLAACVKGRDLLASTGSLLPIGLIVAIAAGLIVTGVVLARRRGLFQAAVDAGAAA
jgi:hypothetical protein